MEEALQAFHDLKPNLPDAVRLSPSQVYKLLDGIPTLVLYATFLLNISQELNDMLLKYIATWQYIRPVTDGNRLSTLKVKPGPIYRQILEQLRDAWLDGIVNTYDEELQLLIQILNEHPDYIEP